MVNIAEPGFTEIARPGGKDVSLNFLDITPDDKKVIFTESNREGLQEFIVPRYTGKDVSTNSFKGGIGRTKLGIAPSDTGATVWIKLPGDDRFYLGDVSLSPDGTKLCIERFSSEARRSTEIGVSFQTFRA